MEQVFEWCAEHAMLCSFIGVVLSFVIGANVKKALNWGFLLSQFIRKTLGKKFENAFESFIGTLHKGMRSDNKQEPKK
jgi:hypothetical protein